MDVSVALIVCGVFGTDQKKDCISVMNTPYELHSFYGSYSALNICANPCSVHGSYISGVCDSCIDFVRLLKDRQLVHCLRRPSCIDNNFSHHPQELIFDQCTSVVLCGCGDLRLCYYDIML